MDEDHGEFEPGSHDVVGGVVQVYGHHEDIHGVADHHWEGVEEELIMWFFQ